MATSKKEYKISKTAFMDYQRHPRYMWDKLHFEPIDTTAIQDAQELETPIQISNGFAFETVVESLFPGMVKVTSTEPGVQIADTRKFMADGARVLFQARFETDRFVVRPDIMIFNEDGTIELIEMKASSSAKPGHIIDLAFQVFVIRKFGFDVVKISVYHVNDEFVLGDKFEPEKFVAREDVTKKVMAKLEEVEKQADEAYKVANKTTAPSLDARLAEPSFLYEWLTLLKTNYPELFIDDSIYKLPALGVKGYEQLEPKKCLRIGDIGLRFDSSQKVGRYITAIQTGSPIVDRRKIRKFLDGLVYPVWMLDYETMMAMVPLFKGMKPFKQYPFQVSVHRLDADGNVAHFEHLHQEKSDPSRAIVDFLKKTIGATGTIMAWFDVFEKTANLTLAEMVPSERGFLTGLNSRMQDLMVPFSEGWYVHPDFWGSASIKSVGPVLVPNLSYKDLDIGKGDLAQQIWMDTILGGKNQGQRSKILNDLLVYCGQDTEIMIGILQFLQTLII